MQQEWDLIIFLHFSEIYLLNLWYEINMYIVCYYIIKYFPVLNTL